MKKLLANKNILFTCIGFFWIFLGFSGAQQYLFPLFKIQGKGDLALISLIILYSSFLASGFFAPKAINSLGLKRSLILGTLTYLLFVVSVVLNITFLFMLASILVGAGASLLWVSSGKIITDSSTMKASGKNLGIQLASVLIGSLLGVTFGGLFLKTLSPDKLYMFFSLAILIGIPFLFLVKIKNKTVKDSVHNVTYLFDRKLIFIFPVIFASYFLSAQTFSSMNEVILSKFGISSIGIFSPLLYISTVTGALTIGKLSDIYDKKIVLYALMSLGVMGSIIFISSSLFLWVIIGTIILGFYISGTYPVALSLIRANLNEKEYIYGIGAFQIYSNTGTVIALFSALNFPTVNIFIAGISFLLLAFPAFYLYNKNYSLSR